MGKKGGDTTYQERPLSAQELQLLNTQNEMLKAGIGVAQQQENRSNAIYDDWRNNYLGMETGEVSAGANRSNGYSNNPNILSADQYAAKKAEYEQNLARLTGELGTMNTPAATQTQTQTQTPTTTSGGSGSQIKGSDGSQYPRFRSSRGGIA